MDKDKDKSKIKIEGVMQLTEVIANLEKLVSDMKAGQVSLSAGDEALTLAPSVLVNVEMKASQKKDKEKFALEISWKKHKEVDGFADLAE
ncbi:MAG: amphi-Trp domain-containing protein [Solidesulfovibrio sp. DCME]|uniref:amphi-Trp domain-containing protein n=1 Tax=Solidesulfovibrio sp. DCME TaxID=3447380 RepID=UPI003D150649